MTKSWLEKGGAMVIWHFIWQSSTYQDIEATGSIGFLEFQIFKILDTRHTFFLHFNISENGIILIINEHIKCSHSFIFLNILLLIHFKSWKMMLWKCCTQYASKLGKLRSGHRTGKGQFSFQSQRKAIPKNTQTTAQLHSSHTLVK